MRDLLLLATRGLRREPVRSLLTLLGVVIAIASIFALTSLTKGLEKTMEEELTKIGTNKIVVIPGVALGANLGGTYLSEADLRAIKSMPGVRHALGIGRKILEVRSGDERRSTTITSVDPNTFEKTFQGLLGAHIEEGRPLEKRDKRRRVALLGYSVAHELFEREIRPGSTLYIEGFPFKVVGVLKRTYSPIDGFIYVPSGVLWKEGNYVRIIVEFSEGADPDRLVKRIKRKLKGLRGGIEDFTVLTTEQAFQRARSILNLVSAFLLTVAAISLVVGGLGIMNTMYMSVVERTREIGIMKALGATRGQILAVFLLEAGMIGLVGGLIGEVLGAGTSILVGTFIGGFLESYRVYIGVDTVLGLALFSFFVGILSGYLPARAASELDPVEALRR